MSALLLLRFATDNSSAQITSSIAPPAASRTEPQATTAIADAYGRLELSFIPNKGQTHGRVKFLSHGPGYELFLTKTETVLTLHRPRASTAENLQSSLLSLRLVDANKNANLEGGDKQPGKVNYFIGKHRQDWRVNIPTYRKVIQRSVYPGIDLVYYGNQRQLEYDFVVAPGADPARIRFQLEGAEQTNLDDNGDLRLTLAHGEVRLRRPVIYQLTNQGGREEVDGSYLITDKGIAFKVGSFDRSKPLIIDPLLIYSTFLGGSGTEQGLGVAVDSHGSAYITGSSTSTDFPLAAPLQGTKDSVEDAFVLKLNPAGTGLVYSTYFGGNGSDVANAIAVDSQGNAYIAGLTGSGSFPTTAGAFQTSKSGSIDAFAAKLNPSGSALVYSTYLGGDNNEIASGVAVDASGRAYVVGRTDSTQLNFFPVQRNGSPVYKSTDGAANWSASDAQLTASAVNAFALDPTNSNTLYAGTNTGVFKSINAGANWNLTGTARPSTAPVFTNTVAVDPSNTSIVYAGMQGGGVFKSTNGGSLYDQKNSGLGSSVVNVLAIDPVNPTTLYAGTSIGIYKSTNGADSWVEIKNGITGTSPRVNEIAIDPINPSTIYIGTNRGMFKTTNGGALWAAINNGPLSNPIPEILALVIDPLAPSTLYAAGRFGSQVLFKSTDGGATWTGSSNGLIYSAGGQSIVPQINMLAINSVSTGTLYAAASGGGIYKSTDGGANWSQANSDVIKSQTLAVAVDRVNPAIVYAGTTIGADAFIARLNGAGSAAEYIMNFGGNQHDEARGVALDASNNAYIIGTTNSQNFPVQNAFQSAFGGLSDAFVSKINAAGTGFIYSTFLGGSNSDLGRAIAVRADRPYVVGQTLSTNFPLVNPIKSSLDQFDGDAFITGFNAAGNALEFSTYFGGGEGFDDALGIALDNGGAIYVTGSTSSPLFPVLNAAQPARAGSVDAFVTKLNPAGTSINFSTYLGGFLTDVGNGIAVDNSGNAFVVGNTSSSNFPTVNPLQSTLKSTDAFIAKIGIQADLSVTKRDSRDPVLVNSPLTYTLNVSNNGPSPATGVMVLDTLPSSLTLNAATPTQGSCSLNNSILTCNLGTLAPSAGAIIAVSVTPTATGMITNTASVTGTEPDAISANNTAAETTNISASPSIRGRVTDANNIGLSGVLMTLTGTQAGSVLTDNMGFYQFAELPIGGNYVITPTKTNFSLEPESITFNSLSTDRSADFVAAVCTYSITPLTQSFSAAGGTGTVSVTSLRGCPWTAASSDSWLNITSGASGLGSGTVNFSVSPTTVPRAAHLTVAGLNFAVYQESNSCGAPSFNVANYSLSSRPVTAKAADLNGDGKVDLVVMGRFAGGDGAVMLNNGAGTFTTSSVSSGFEPQDFAISDLNGDNWPDLSFSNYNFSAVRILFNNGSGGFTFTSRTDIPFTSQGQPPFTRGMFSADLNNDSKADLLVWTPGASAVQVLLATGGSGFSQVAPVVGSSFDVPIGIVDVNDDGKPDLIYGGGGDNGRPISVRLGDGAGGFGTLIVSSGMIVSAYMGTGDFNGDGKLDLVASAGSGSSNIIAVLAGNGTGLFTVKSSFVTAGMPNLTVADFNRDGKLDVAFVIGGSKATVVLGDGLGGLGNAIPIDTGASDVTGGNFGITSGDFNGDARPDIGVADYGMGASVLLNGCPAASTSLSISDFNVIEGNTGTVNAVFNVNLSAPSSGTVTVSYNTGNGTATVGSDYVGGSGLVSFTPGQTTKTLTVPVNGDTATEANETFVVNLFTPTNATISKAVGTSTILNDDGGQVPIQLMFEDAATEPNRLATLDALLLTRDPFRVLSIGEWWNLGTDRNTRVVVFATNLSLNPGETAADVVVTLIDSSSQTHNIAAEDVRAIPGSDFTQVRFRLPNGLPAGNCTIVVKAHGQTSNTGIFRIAP
ncbi:MAG TPA: SBBP repeat-containing protein [Pyrinomonadaceae bacterium]